MITIIKENAAQFLKIASKSFMKWLFLVAIGEFFALISFLLIAFKIDLFTHEQAFSAYLSQLIVTNFFAFLVILLTPFFMFLYVMFANKFIIQYIMYQVWQSKIQDFVIERIVKIVDKIVYSNEKIGKILDVSMLKIKMLHENTTDKSANKVVKKVSAYVIQKIKLDEVDLSKQDLRISHIIAEKVTNFISETTEPSMNMNWILFGIHLVIFVLAF